MINFPLRRASLAVAVIAALSIRAAAQTDAAFASALGKIPSGLATMALLKTQAQKPAEVQGPRASEDAWNKAIRTVLDYGKTKPIPGRPEILYTIMNVNGPLTSKVVVVQEVSAIVLRTTDGNVEVYTVQFVVTMNTYIPERLHVLQESWVFETSGDGQLQSVVHATNIVKSKTDIVRGTPENLDITAPETKSHFDDTIAYWGQAKS